jgi:transposase
MDTIRRSVNETGIVQKVPLAAPKRQQRTVQEKRRIVEETLAAGASVARVARAHGVNANQVFGWRRLYRAGRLGGSGAVKLLPVSVSENSSPMAAQSTFPATSPMSERSALTPLPGTIHIKLGQAQVRIEGNVEPALLRVLLESLRR